jgi:hypothetical protein
MTKLVWNVLMKKEGEKKMEYIILQHRNKIFVCPQGVYNITPNFSG